MENFALKLYFSVTLTYFITQAYLANPNLKWSPKVKVSVELVTKCVPCLILAIWFRLILYRMKGESENDETTFRMKKRLNLCSQAFFWSMVGDAAMIFKSSGGFPIAVITFGVAQVCFSMAFGWETRKKTVGISLYIFCVAKITCIFVVHLFGSDPLQGVELVITTIGVTIYCILIYTAMWRSIDKRTLTTIKGIGYIRCLGVLMFIVSDTFIAVNTFAITIPFASFLIMVSYYMAQGLIAFAESTPHDVDNTKPE